MPTLGTNIVVIQDNKVLLTKRSDVPMWCLPGGGVDAGESVAQTAVREVHEETGLTIQLTRFVGVYSRPNWGIDGDHVLLFTAVPIDGTLQMADGEVIDQNFFDPNQLPQPILWWHIQRIKDAFAGVTGAAWSQDVAWPFGQLTRQEVFAQRAQMQTKVPDLVAQLATMGHQQREL